MFPTKRGDVIKKYDKTDPRCLPTLPTRTIYQPYASAIFDRLKWYETAPRRTNIRGRIYIHAASTLPPRIYVPFLQSTANLPDGRGYTLDWLHSLPFGAILGTVDIIDCIPVEEIRSGLTARELAFGDYSDGRWAYKLANPIVCPRAIPAKGKQGWWYFGCYK